MRTFSTLATLALVATTSVFSLPTSTSKVDTNAIADTVLTQLLNPAKYCAQFNFSKPKDTSYYCNLDGAAESKSFTFPDTLTLPQIQASYEQLKTKVSKLPNAKTLTIISSPESIWGGRAEGIHSGAEFYFIVYGTKCFWRDYAPPELKDKITYSEVDVRQNSKVLEPIDPYIQEADLAGCTWFRVRGSEKRTKLSESANSAVFI